jgi:alanine dehydrogenase
MLICYGLLPGAKALRLVTEEDLETRKDGSVIVDVAVDQGGCVETIRPTTHDDPTYVVHGVVDVWRRQHARSGAADEYGALTNATLTCVISLARKGWQAACAEDVGSASDVNIVEGQVTCRGVADAFGMECRSLRDVMAMPVTA